jgi:hypothetical protein
MAIQNSFLRVIMGQDIPFVYPNFEGTQIQNCLVINQ